MVSGVCINLHASEESIDCSHHLGSTQLLLIASGTGLRPSHGMVLQQADQPAYCGKLKTVIKNGMD